ncbi:beta-catenin-like protein [Encephalitozoon intestinalis]
MDSEDGVVSDDVMRVSQKIKESGSTDSLEKLLIEHKYNPGYVEKFYNAFSSRGNDWESDVYEVFGNHFLRNRLYGGMAGVLMPWVESVKKRYSVEECKGVFEYFNKMYDEMPASTKEGMYGTFLEVLLGLGWTLSKGGALYESYAVCEKVCEIVTSMGKFSSSNTAILYMELLGSFFLESGMLFSYVNVINILTSLEPRCIQKQCSIEDFRTLCSYALLKNEGDKQKKLFCKSRLLNLPEILSNVEKRCSGIDVSGNTLIRRKFDFEMWGKYSECVGKRVLVEENMDLIAFMKKNDFRFSIDGTYILIEQYEYKTVERKVFEIIEEYKGRTRTASKPVIERKRISEEKKIVKKEEPSRPKKTVKFRDRFSSAYKKVKMYSRYYMKNAKGIEDAWYEKRNKEAKEAFEKKENKLKTKREELRAYLDLVEEARKGLSQRIEELGRKIEVPMPKPTRSAHWRSEGEEAKVYRPPNPHSSGTQKAYVPPLDAFRHIPSENPGGKSDSNPFRRNRNLRNSSWYVDNKEKEQEKKNN